MSQQEEKRTDYGTVKIHRNVIVQIARVAAVETEGVSRISQDIFSRLLDLATKGKISRHPVKIEFRENNEVVISIGIVVNYGVNIPEVAASVQEKIKKSVEKMTGLYLTDVHIKVKGVEVK